MTVTSPALATRNTPNRQFQHFSGLPVPFYTVTTDSTAGAITYTAAQLLGGLIIRDPNGGGRTDILPTAALLVAAVPGVQVGSAFRFTIRNNADAAETITLNAGTGGTLSAAGQSTTTSTVVQNASREYLCYFSNVTPGSEAVIFYSLVSGTH